MRAFPISYQWSYEYEGNNGMDLRDYFAARLMVRMLDKTSSATGSWYEDSAKKCYLMADAMMKAREE